MNEELTEEQLLHRRASAAEVFESETGKRFVSFLLDDLGLYDIPLTESDMVLHNFAILFLRR